MGWEKIFTATAGIDEAEEGAELDWAERDFHGEELAPARDDEWPACPRATLREGDVDRASLRVVAAATGLALEVVDLDDALAVPVPPRTKVFARAHEGSDFDRTRLYFHPDYEGATVYADYRYWPTGADFHGFAAGERLEFAERGSGRWFTWDGLAAAPAGKVKPGEPGVGATAAGDSGEVWALTAAGSLLARRGRVFAGCLDVAGVELAGREWLGLLAQACCATAALSPDGVFSFGAGSGAPVRRIFWSSVRDVRMDAAPAPALRVELTYRGGRVAAGEGPATCSYDNRLITSKAHAQLVCDWLAARLAGEGDVLTLVVGEECAAAPGSALRFALGPGREEGLFRVLAAARDFARYTAELKLVRITTRGVANELE